MGSWFHQTVIFFWLLKNRENFFQESGRYLLACPLGSKVAFSAWVLRKTLQDCIEKLFRSSSLLEHRSGIESDGSGVAGKLLFGVTVWIIYPHLILLNLRWSFCCSRIDCLLSGTIWGGVQTAGKAFSNCLMAACCWPQFLGHLNRVPGVSATARLQRLGKKKPLLGFLTEITINPKPGTRSVLNHPGFVGSSRIW